MVFSTAWYSVCSISVALAVPDPPSHCLQQKRKQEGIEAFYKQSNM
jgi:hypothetical protein